MRLLVTLAAIPTEYTELSIEVLGRMMMMGEAPHFVLNHLIEISEILEEDLYARGYLKLESQDMRDSERSRNMYRIFYGL